MIPVRVRGKSSILAIKLFSLGDGVEFTTNTLLLQIFLEESLQKLKVHQPLKIFLACAIFISLLHRKSNDVADGSRAVTMSPKGILLSWKIFFVFSWKQFLFYVCFLKSHPSEQWLW